MKFFFFVLLTGIHLAFAKYDYIDGSCDTDAISTASDEAKQAVATAVSNLDDDNAPSRVTNFLKVVLGQPKTSEDGVTIKDNFRRVISGVQTLLGDADNNVALYCGDSIKWSNMIPNTAPNAGCNPNTFNPFRTRPVCAAPAGAGANGGEGGFFYAPYPSNAIPKPQLYWQISGEPPRGPQQKVEGKAYCRDPGAGGITWYNPRNSVQMLCPSVFSNDKKGYVGTNKNEEYYGLIDKMKTARQIGAHLENPTAVMIHELSHAQGEGIDAVLSDGKTLAYKWSGVTELAELNKGKSATENNCFKNCDTIASFCLAMLMSKNDWSEGKAREPK